MKNLIVNKINFPEFTGVRCSMMPFIQGDSSSLPEEYKSYAKVVDDNYLEKGEIGFLTIDERFVNAGKSQRGFNSLGLNRNVHIEVGRCAELNRWEAAKLLGVDRQVQYLMIIQWFLLVIVFQTLVKYGM